MPNIVARSRNVSCRLIIFDKDGTLIDLTATWVPLIRKRAHFVLSAAGGTMELEALLLRAWGIEPETGKVDPRGPCPISLRSEEIVAGTLTLYQQGYAWDEAKELVSRAFDQADAASDRRQMLKPIEGVCEILKDLKNRGFRLAVATSDERRDTEAMFSSLNMEGLFDVVVCAGETNSPKPHPGSILTICERVSVPPREAVLIGDTVTDMIMGKRAGTALTIGIVEGGVTPRHELEKFADVVLESLRELRFF